MPAIHPAALIATLAAAGLAPAAADTTWTTTVVEPAQTWTTTVVRSRDAAPTRHVPVSRTGRRRHLPWRPTSTCPAIDGGTWRVRPGDTLWLVAGCTGTTVRQVAGASGIAPTAVLRVGQALDVPPAATR